MRNSITVQRGTTRTIVLAICAAALALMLMAALLSPAYAGSLNPPPVPANIEPPAGSKLIFAGHAIGTQNYMCLPAGAGTTWTFIGPQATLFGQNGEQVATHFLSPNPAEAGTARATWQHSRDSSTVWASATATSSDPAYVTPGAIPWLLLGAVGSDEGSRNNGKLAETAFVQRVNTTGGLAPSAGCASTTDVGQRAFVPYTADYFFYK